MIKTGWTSAAALLGAAVIISGCSSTRLSGPAPLTPAPSGSVTSSQLPPPSSPGGFPDAPATETATPETSETTTDPNAGADLASATPVDRNALVGAWQVSTAGSSCQMFMALTSWSGGFRAASRGCPGDAANVSVWNINGGQVVLSDSNGNRVATLVSSGANRFNGTTTSGTAISLSR